MPSHNPVIRTEINQVYIHATLYDTLKKYYISKAEMPIFKRLIGFQSYIEPNIDLFKELQSLLEILDMYRKTETLKNEHKLQFVQDRIERQNGDLFFKKKIIQHVEMLLGGSSDLNIVLRKLNNARWRNIIRDLYASKDEAFSIVPLAKRLTTPRSDESRTSSTSSSSEMGENICHKSTFFINAFDEIDLESEKDNLKVEYLMHEKGEPLLKRIRDAFLQEKVMLLADVDYIRSVLENESEFNHKVSHFIFPTSQELCEIEQHLSEIVENHEMQEKMVKLTSKKVSKLLTPRKQKLPPQIQKHTSISTKSNESESEKLSREDRQIAPPYAPISTRYKAKVVNKENVQLNQQKGSTQTVDSLSNTLSWSSHDGESTDKPHSTISSQTSRNKDLSNFLSGNSDSEPLPMNRKRPSTASRLRNAVLSNRIS